jgi:hypothetical protein
LIDQPQSSQKTLAIKASPGNLVGLDELERKAVAFANGLKTFAIDLFHAVNEFLSLRDCLTYCAFIRGHMRAVWTNAKIQT